MALDRNELTRLVTKVPKITSQELPSVAEKIKWVETQIEEYQKGMYRQTLDLKVALNYATKDDMDAVSVAEQKIREVTGNVKGIKWSLEALRKELTELKSEQKASEKSTK